MGPRLRRLIFFLYKGSQEAEALLSAPLLAGRWAFFLVASLALALPLTATIARNVRRWTRLAAEVELPKTQWRALYAESPAPCGADARSTPGCFANPGEPALWESPTSRADHQRHKARVFARQGREYWVGTTITPEQKRKALSLDASVLVLGQLRGSWRVWVDGRQLLSGEWLDNEPLALPLPLEWLTRPGPLRVAVWLVKNVDVNDSADLLEDSPRLGLMTKASATAWRRYYGFWGTARPLAFLAANFILAWLFFAFWLVEPEKAEYFYMALLAMAFALFQLRYVDLYYITTDRKVVNFLGLSSAVFYGFSGMLAGFAFARLRPAILNACLAACAALCVAMPLLIRDTIAQQINSAFWLTRFSDWSTVLGAAACWLQALHLLAERRGRPDLDLRMKRLGFFGAGLLALVALNQISYALGDPSAARLVLGKSGPFLTLLPLGLIAISDFRAQRRLAQAVPITRFHRMEPLPDSVSGVLLSVDLKGSENIARFSATLGRSGELVETCLSHMWTAVSNGGGCVIHTGGDALIALFPDDEHADPAETAFKAVVDMRRSLASLERRFQAQGMGGAALSEGLHFRAALFPGEIRPIWQEYGGARAAGWVETGRVNGLIEVSRLLELERQAAPKDAPASVLVVPSMLAGELGGAAREGAWLFERRSFGAKHGRSYEVAAFRVEPAAAQPA